MAKNLCFFRSSSMQKMWPICLVMCLGLDVVNLTTFTSQSGKNNPYKSQSFFSFPAKKKKSFAKLQKFAHQTKTMPSM